MEQATLFRIKMPIKLGYILIFAIPLITAKIFSSIWVHIDPYLPRFSANDNFALFGSAGLLGVTYTVFAAQMIGSSWGKFEEIRILCRRAKEGKAKEEDKDIFIVKKDLHTNPLMHFALGYFATVIATILGLVSYDSTLVGQIVVGSWISFATTLMIISIELDNPLNGVWYIKPPKEWINEIPIKSIKTKTGKARVS